MSMTSSGRFLALDGLRGVLAVLIALMHLGVLGHFYGFAPLRGASLAVDVFFLLSGFVITHSYLGRLHTFADAARFTLRRIGRLWPLHMVMFLLVAGNELIKLAIVLSTGFQPAVMPFAPESAYPLLGIPANILMVHGMGTLPWYSFNGPSWSISTEFFTYLVFAACFLLCRRWYVAAASGLVVAAALLLLHFNGSLGAGYDYGVFRCLLGFFLGSLTYLAFRHAPNLRLSPQKTLATGAEAACLLLFLALTSLNGSPWSLAAPFALTVTLWVFAQQRGALSKLLLSRPLQKLGLWSYGIYMVHFFILLCFMRVVRVLDRLTPQTLLVEQTSPANGRPLQLVDFGNPWLNDLTALIYLTLVIAAAALAHRCVEQPGQRFFNTLAARWQSIPSFQSARSPAT
jgi:peptidoglycan/LPS O-acetylase OafA/YrhL